jgi:hypothetical protein
MFLFCLFGFLFGGFGLGAVWIFCLAVWPFGLDWDRDWDCPDRERLNRACFSVSVFGG